MPWGTLVIAEPNPPKVSISDQTDTRIFENYGCIKNIEISTIFTLNPKKTTDLIIMVIAQIHVQNHVRPCVILIAAQAPVG